LFAFHRVKVDNVDSRITHRSHDPACCESTECPAGSNSCLRPASTEQEQQWL
jgi:hypothetical protein